MYRKLARDRQDPQRVLPLANAADAKNLSNGRDGHRRELGIFGHRRSRVVVNSSGRRSAGRDAMSWSRHYKSSAANGHRSIGPGTESESTCSNFGHSGFAKTISVVISISGSPNGL